MSHESTPEMQHPAPTDLLVSHAPSRRGKAAERKDVVGRYLHDPSSVLRSDQPDGMAAGFEMQSNTTQVAEALADHADRSARMQEWRNGTYVFEQNEKAGVAVFGAEDFAGGGEIRDFDTGEVISTKENPIKGKIHELREKRNTPIEAGKTLKEQASEAEESYKAELQTFLDDDMDISQGKLILDIKEARKQKRDIFVKNNILAGFTKEEAEARAEVAFKGPRNPISDGKSPQATYDRMKAKLIAENGMTEKEASEKAKKYVDLKQERMGKKGDAYDGTPLSTEFEPKARTIESLSDDELKDFIKANGIYSKEDLDYVLAGNDLYAAPSKRIDRKQRDARIAELKEQGVPQFVIDKLTPRHFYKDGDPHKIQKEPTELTEWKKSLADGIAAATPDAPAAEEPTAPIPTPKPKAKRGVRFDKLGNAIVVVDGDTEPDVENTPRMIEVSKNSGKVALLSFLGRERIERLNGQELARNQKEWGKIRERIDPGIEQDLQNTKLGNTATKKFEEISPEDKAGKEDQIRSKIASQINYLRHAGLPVELVQKELEENTKFFTKLDSQPELSGLSDEVQVWFDENPKAREDYIISPALVKAYDSLSEDEKVHWRASFDSVANKVDNLLDAEVPAELVKSEILNIPNQFMDPAVAIAIENMSDGMKAWFDANPDAKTKYLEIIGDDTDDEADTATIS